MAFASSDSRGRRVALDDEDMDPFEYDYVLAANHFIVSRMADKRQVFSWMSMFIEADSRLTHTVIAIRIAQAIALGLHLNEHLTASIALCHDVAHCPFGHLGETILNLYLAQAAKANYDHVAVAPFVLSEVAGLALSYEVLEGITWHSLYSGVLQADVPSEYRVVAFADKIAYVLSDAWDAVRVASNSLHKTYTLLDDKGASSLRSEVIKLQRSLGQSDDERLDRMVEAVVRESIEAGEITLETSREATILRELKDLLTEKLYSYTDLPEDIDCLHRVLEMLIASDIRANPYLLFALLTDSEMCYLENLGRPITPADIELLQVAELNLPGQDDFRFLDPSFWQRHWH